MRLGRVPISVAGIFSPAPDWPICDWQKRDRAVAQDL